MTLLERIIQIAQGRPKVAILMSGQGSNARVILENRKRYPNLNIVAICTDEKNSGAKNIAREFGKQYLFVQLSANNQSKERLFRAFEERLESLGIELMLYAGFMKVSPPFFVKRFPGINVHPADLTIKDKNGNPKYVGMPALSDALKDGQPYVASTVHVVDETADFGQPIAVSRHLLVNPEERLRPELVHLRLKRECEHALYPRVLELLSRGEIRSSQAPLQMDKNHGSNT